MASYDILIKSGTVFDGKGNPPQAADLGIKDGKITDIGVLAGSSAKTVIDASGKYVTPGFIDITDHSDTHLTIFKYPALESLLLQGVTTIIGGNCGASLAPLTSSAAIDAIRKWADPSEFNLDWIGIKEYLDTLEKLSLPLNYGTLAGYGTMRRGVTGGESRHLTPEENNQLKQLLSRSMEEGAFGLSLGLSYGHERSASTEEIIELAKNLSEYSGVVKLHLRSEGSQLFAAVNEAIQIARATDIQVIIAHFKAVGRKAWPSFKKALELIEHASSSGVKITFDVSPYSTTGSPLYLLIPAWAREGGFDELFKRMNKPEEKKKIMASIKTQTLHYDKILIVSAKIPSVVGKTMAEIAEHSGLSPEEALLDTVRANEGRVSIIGRTVSARNVRRAVLHRDSIIASDGAGYSTEAAHSGSLTHPRSFGAFPHFWHTFVRDKKWLTAEEAIRKITSLPAETLGIKKRGAIIKGNFADIAVFDPESFKDRATYKNPYQYPAGMEWVVINGRVVVKEGVFQKIKAGAVLRKN